MRCTAADAIANQILYIQSRELNELCVTIGNMNDVDDDHEERLN